MKEQIKVKGIQNLLEYIIIFEYIYIILDIKKATLCKMAFYL
jgi:hypothetical protein